MTTNQGPVQIETVHLPVTRKRIVQGNYNGVYVGHIVDGAVMVAIQGRYHDAADLRAAAEVFTLLADALEDQK